MIPAVRSNPPETHRALRWWVEAFGDVYRHKAGEVIAHAADHNAIADHAGARLAR